MRRQLSLAPHFGNVFQLWASPILKHKVNVIMNLNICVEVRTKNTEVLGMRVQCKAGVEHKTQIS
jgi:hypothetical protein